MPKKLDDMQKAIKAQLKKDNPNMSEDELESRAWAIANDRFKKMKKKESISDKLDEDGNIIVGENVKVFLEGNVNYIEE